MKKEEKHSELAFKITSIFLAITAVLIFLLYYVEIFNLFIDILLTLVVLYFGVESFLYIKRTKEHKKSYIIITTIFFIAGITHLFRIIYGPLQCNLSSKFLSIYLYDGLALILGLILIYYSLILVKKHSGNKHIHILGIVIGSVMVINHVIKIAIGRCV